MTVIIEKPAINLREELADLRNQGTYQEQQFWFDGLVTNGTFDADANWTKGTGWTISGGTANASAATTGSLTQAISLTSGRAYSVTYTVSGISAGQFIARFTGGTTVSGTGRTANGTYTELLTAAPGNTTLDILQSTDCNGSIDNVSVFETDGTDVVHRMPKGWVPKDVFEDGLLQREGAANDYTVVYDGFDYYVKPAVAPSATTQTCVIGVRT